MIQNDTSLSEIFDDLRNILGKRPDLRPRLPLEKISLSTRFKEDLGFDSLAVISFFMDLQNLHPHLDELEISKWIIIGDCVNAISNNPRTL